MSIYKDLLMSQIIGGGGGHSVEVVPLSITENGVYNAEEGKAFNPVEVEVSKSASENEIEFIDYDGTIVTSMSKSDFLSLTELPENPTHEGLVSQGWNWTLQDAKEYLESNDYLCIGQLYTTDNGRTRLYISLPNNTLLSPTIQVSRNVGTMTIYWGDGTSENITTNTISHTYASTGNYIIEIESSHINNSISSSNYAFYNLFGYLSTSNQQAYTGSLKKVEMGDNLQIGDGAFQSCTNLQTITVSQSSIKNTSGMFRMAYSLKSITIPSVNRLALSDQSFGACYQMKNISLGNGIYYLGPSCFASCYNLSKISFPNSVVTFHNNCFQFTPIKAIDISRGTFFGASVLSECRWLETVKMPTSSTITSMPNYLFSNNYSLSSLTVPVNLVSIKGNAFQWCSSLKEVTFLGSITEMDGGFSTCDSLEFCDLSNCASVPSLTTSSAFSTKARFLRIIVPDALYNEWISATNWSTYADKIVKASEV